MAIWNALKETKNRYPTFLGSAKHPRIKLTIIINERLIAFPFIATFSDDAAK